MRKTHRIISLALCAVTALTLASGCGGKKGDPSSPGGEDGVFTIAYAPNESTTESADARNGMAEDLKEVLGCEVEEIQASDYNAIIEALRTGKADMAYMGSQALALGVERTELEPIVMKAEEGDNFSRGYICESRHYNLISRLQSEGHQCNLQGVRAVGAGY